MPLNLDNAKAAKPINKPAQPNQSSALATKTPGLDKLEAQLKHQADSMEDAARQIVKEGMEQAKLQVRGAISDELAAIAGDDDFFDISSLFEGEGAAELEPESEQETELTIDVAAVAAS